ncbi:MAG: beta-lactamase-like protein [uncultured bacterium]|nr:MAG: beta-lactamase-like protein [uncultured bacterium]HLD44400.1 MBL fold metallo-hydrolase [bacterium]
MPVLPKTAKEWYQVRQIRPKLFEVHEPQHVSFFVLKHRSQALFIDSGLGLEPVAAKRLLKKLNIKDFSVLLTHAHCDHIGLSHLAKKIYVNPREWKKHIAQNEIRHLSIYHELLAETLPWPRKYAEHPHTKSFEPTNFIKLNQHISFGPFKLKPLPVPGHTKGSLAFYEPSLNVLFLGDFVYNGIIYINLKDSSLGDYLNSMNRILAFFHKTQPHPLLLPCHNDIPLDPAYLYRVKKVLEKLVSNKIKPRGRWPLKRFFQSSHVYIDQGVRLVVKDDQFPNR